MFRKYIWLITPLYTKLLIVFYFAGTYLLFRIVCDFDSVHLADESYHLEMGIRYCKEKYDSWNDELASIPGIYWVSVIILRFMKFIFQSDTCNILLFRCINYIFGVGNITLFGLIIRIICKSKACYYGIGINTSRIYTINHAMLPVYYIFTFFYDPEPMSVFTVFLMYYLYLKGHHTIAASSGFIAITVYQSNVVWVGFICMLQFMTAMMYNLRKWDNYRQVIDAGKHVPIIKILVRYTSHVFTTCDKLVMRHFIHSKYFFVCAIFFCVKLCDNYIVIMDEVAHSFVIHIPQLLYFCLFYIIFSPCSVVLSIPNFLRYIQSAKKETTLIVVSLAIIIYCNTLTYPYLLTDGRFYEFYVWKQLYEGNVMFRYLLIPFYMLGGYAIIEKLKDEKTPFIIAYMASVVLLLCTRKIFEFRYYLLPYFFLTIHTPKRHVTEIFIENIYYILINILVVIFLFRQEIVKSQGPM